MSNLSVTFVHWIVSQAPLQEKGGETEKGFDPAGWIHEKRKDSKADYFA